MHIWLRRSMSIACLFLTPFAGFADDAGRVTEERLSPQAGPNWLVRGGGYRGAHFSTLDQIDTANVGDLGLNWSAGLPAPDGISATPLVVDGVVYLSGPFSDVWAVDAANGEILWSFDAGVRQQLAARPRMSWSARSNRGVAVWHGKVFVATADCRLIAIDASTGEANWSVATCDPALGYGISDAPHVGAGLVFIGNSGSESGQKNRGYVSAYDAATGALRWRFFTVPGSKPEENDSEALKMAAKTWSGDALEKFGGGGSAWNEMTYDAESGLLFFGTAGALPYLYHQRSPDGGDNLFTSSVVAVDAASGEYRWHYQTVPQDSWEYNATMNIVLADLELDGKRREVLMIAPKNGFFYVLDRRNGEFISADKYVRVTWAKGINPETGRPVYDLRGEYWRLPPGETVAVWPNMWGSHSWHPMAWHPQQGLAYIPAIDAPSIVTMYEGGDFTDTMDLIDEVDGKPHSPGRLVAWDPRTQRERWSVKHSLPFNGGVLATAGDLVFQGDATGVFSAYHAANGERLWSVKTGSAINAAPVSYEVDDRQYVLIPVGAGGGVQFVYPELSAGEDTGGPTRLLAFTLDGDMELPRFGAMDRTLPTLPELTDDGDVIEHGAELYAGNCGFCHGKNAVARYGGSVPDLRFSSAGTHQAWSAIVIGGAQRATGMPAFEISLDDAEAIRQYVVSRAYALGNGQ